MWAMSFLKESLKLSFLSTVNCSKLEILAPELPEPSL